MDGRNYGDELARRFIRESDAALEENPQPDTHRDGAAADPGAALARKMLEENVVQALKRIYDPEIPVNIYDLGLIYGVDVDADNRVHVNMTLTSPGCPVAQTFPGMVECAVREVEGVKEACVELVWDPPWSKEKMSEAALFELGLL